MATKWERIAARTGHPFDNVPGLPCRLIDPDVFFPKPGHKADRAVAACQTCPITVECLSFALETGSGSACGAGRGRRTATGSASPSGRRSPRRPGSRSSPG